MTVANRYKRGIGGGVVRLVFPPGVRRDGDAAQRRRAARHALERDRRDVQRAAPPVRYRRHGQQLGPIRRVAERRRDRVRPIAAVRHRRGLDDARVKLDDQLEPV